MTVLLALAARVLGDWRAWAIVLALFLVAVVYAAGFDKGGRSVREELRRQDERADGASREAVTDVARCYDLGREWDASRGLCR